MPAQVVPAAAVETVQAGVPRAAITHAEVAAADAVMSAAAAAALVVKVVALAHRRRMPWINQRLRTRATW